MHISDGILSTPVLLAGVSATAFGCALGLRRIEPERIPQVALVSSVLFVAALVHFPIGPSSVHLVLNGLAGVMLGWAAFPAMVVALLLQAVMFGFGGLTVLGINAINLALPGVLCGLLFDQVRRRGHPRLTLIAAGAAGGSAVLLSGLLTVLSIRIGAPQFGASAWLVLAANLPVAIIEAVFTASAVGLVLKVKPEALERLPMELVPSHA